MGRRITAVITYLEMFEPPARRSAAPVSSPMALMRADTIPLHYYRYLYRTIGHDHYWIDRLELSDAELEAAVHAEGVEIYVLYVGGVPAGYYELDFRRRDDVELLYLGLLPEFTGRGYGPYLLTCALDRAWETDPSRVHIQTNTLDHPAALSLYQKFGFRPYAQDVRSFEPPEGYQPGSPT